MPKGVPYFKADLVHDGKKVTKHFVQLAGLTEQEILEVLDQFVELVWQDVEDDGPSKNAQPDEGDALSF